MRKNLNISFMAAAKNIRLMPSERRGILDNVLANCVTDSDALPILRPEEKRRLRAELQDISSRNPRTAHLLPEREVPLSVWLGTNLFGHLKPFVI